MVCLPQLTRPQMMTVWRVRSRAAMRGRRLRPSTATPPTRPSVATWRVYSSSSSTRPSYSSRTVVAPSTQTLTFQVAAVSTSCRALGQCVSSLSWSRTIGWLERCSVVNPFRCRVFNRPKHLQNVLFWVFRVFGESNFFCVIEHKFVMMFK